MLGACLTFPVAARCPHLCPTSTVYSERLTLGPLGWVLLIVFATMLGIAFVPVDVRLALLLGAVVLVGGAVPPRVHRAGGAGRRDDAAGRSARRSRSSLVGGVSALDAAGARAELGPRLDARAYLCLRGWIHTAVRVELVDPLDPTPYWIVSTRHPDALAAALTGS